MKLRKYQIIASETVRAELRQGRSVVAVSPTGSGKTVIGVDVARREKRVVWLVHRYELIKQAERHLLDAGAHAKHVGVLSGRETRNAHARFVVASIDMPRAKLAPLLRGTTLVVIDEAHRSRAKTYRAALALAPSAHVLGLTATPCRLDGRGLGDVFDRLIVCATQTELIADRFIAQPVTYGLSREAARALVRGVSTSGGDYVQSRLGQAMSSRTLLGRVVSEWQRLAEGRSTLVFASSRWHARRLVEQFKRAHVHMAYLDGETPAVLRDAMLRDLADGTLTGIVSVDVLVEGFDCPAVKCIVLARPTKSLTRFLQQVGRGSRIKGRMRPIVIDHAGNTWRFGLPESERSWSLADVPRDGGDAPVKCCAECGAMIAASAAVCTECGAEQPLEPRRLTERDVELERLKAQRDEIARARAALERIAVARNAPPGWVDAALAELAS